MRIFGDLASGNCLKVKWTCDHLALPYEWVDIDILQGESRTPTYLEKNPFGQVSVIELDDGRRLAQSNAIILYLATNTALLPNDPFDRAKVTEWLFWEQYSHEPYVGLCRFQMKYLGKSRDQLDPDKVERGAKALETLDNALQGREFLVAETPSVADIALIAYSRVADEGGFDLALYTNLRAWITRVEAACSIT